MRTILFLLLTLAIVAYISYPLLRKSPQNIVDVVSDEGMLELFAERDSAYMALADLDFDHECGKVSDKDYQKLRQELLQDAASALARIDADSANLAVEKPQEQQVEDAVEAEIARYKKKKKSRT